MPPSIEPRGKRPSFELKNFTDREPQREILARLLSLKPGQPLPVLHFYGVGGIGKSWLLELWHQSINDPAWLKLALYPHIPVGFINLEKAGSDEAANLHRVAPSSLQCRALASIPLMAGCVSNRKSRISPV